MTGIPVQGALPRAVATVGVVGAGRVGAVLAAKFRAAGHPVVECFRGWMLQEAEAARRF